MSTVAGLAEDARAARHDPVGEAVDRLRERLPSRADCVVSADFLEDDLREGLSAVGEVEAHFTDVLDALRSERLSPIGLIDAADDQRVLERLEYLMGVVGDLRLWLSQTAGQLRRSR